MDKATYDLVLAALRTSQAEFLSLYPRLSKPYQDNAKACAKLCGDAIKELDSGHGG